MRRFRIKSYLHLPLGTSEVKIRGILDSNFSSSLINSIDKGENEIVVDFEIIIESSTEENAEKQFLNTMFEYNIGDYVIMGL